MIKLFRMISYLLVLLFAFSCNQNENPAEPEATATKPPVEGIRIAWDYRTLKRVSNDDKTRYNGYARLIQLADKSLMCVYESDGNTVFVKSTNNGVTWSSPVVIAPKLDGVNMAVPDIIQLKDQSIMVCYNPRPVQKDPQKRFGIRTIKSYDGGSIWKDERLLYEAGVDFENGCWEPAAIQLESGEIQLFFANEGLYTNSSEQNISLLRSSDGGLTWTRTPEIASFRAGKRDGMPSPLILQNGKDIVFSIEDNGEGDFKPYIIRTPLTNPWQTLVEATSPNRTYALFEKIQESIYAGAPYLRQLKRGETILSYQGTENRTNKLEFAEMKVVIGDSEAKNFNRKSSPFVIPSSKSGLWNSVSVLEGDTIVALTSTNAFSSAGNTEVWMIKGFVMPEVEVNNKTVAIDGQQNEQIWSENFPVFIGQKGNTQSMHHYSYDNDHLYVVSKIRDKNIVVGAAVMEDNDGITYFVDATNKSLELPGKGIFSLYLSADNKLTVKEGSNTKWTERKDVKEVKHFSKNVEGGYIQEIAIPWALLGGKPAKNSRVGINVLLTETTSKGAIDYREGISSNEDMKPYTWSTLLLK